MSVELGAGLAVAVAVAALGVSLAAASRPRLRHGWSEVAPGLLPEGVLVLAIWVVAFRYPTARARAGEALRLAREAELAELRARLQPHFLGNSLNAIAWLLREQPERARDLLAELGELLRDLAAEPGESWPLAREIAWCRRYVPRLASSSRARPRAPPRPPERIMHRPAPAPRAPAATWPLLILPAEPVYGRCTPTESSPGLRKPASSRLQASMGSSFVQARGA